MKDLKEPLIHYKPISSTPQRQRLSCCWCYFFLLLTLFTLWPRAVQTFVRDVVFDRDTLTLDKDLVFHNPNVYPYAMKNVSFEEYYKDCSIVPCFWNKVSEKSLGEVQIPALGSTHISVISEPGDYNLEVVAAFAALCLNDNLILQYVASSNVGDSSYSFSETGKYRVICDI